MDKKRVLWISLGALGLAFALAHPLLRQVLLFLLPLGSGFDDLIEIGAIVVGLVFLAVYLLKGRITIKRRPKRIGRIRSRKDSK